MCVFVGMKDTLGGRRFLLAGVSALIATILQWNGKLDPAGSSYAMIMVGIVAAYITGNVVERNTITRSGGTVPFVRPQNNTDDKDRT